MNLGVNALSTAGTVVGKAINNIVTGITAEANLQFQTAAGTTAAITYAIGASAAEIAAAINAGGGSFGLAAVASNSATFGSLVFAVETSTVLTATLNGSAISANITNVNDLSALASAVNAVAGATGVSATFANPTDLSVIG